MEIYDIVPIAILTFNSITDIKERIVEDKTAYFLLLYSIIVFFLKLSDILDVLSFLLLSVFFFILYISGKIADGDFVLLFSISLLLNLKEAYIFLINLGISTVIVSAIYVLKKKSILLIIPLVLVFLLRNPYKILLLIVILILSCVLFKIEKIQFWKEVYVKDLIQGDILLEDIVIDGKIVFKNPGRSLLSTEVRRLKEICPDKKVKILWGIPYVPAILLAYLLTKTLNIAFL